jgi:hypothetical protein
MKLILLYVYKNCTCTVCHGALFQGYRVYQFKCEQRVPNSHFII